MIDSLWLVRLPRLNDGHSEELAHVVGEDGTSPVGDVRYCTLVWVEGDRPVVFASL